MAYLGKVFDLVQNHGLVGKFHKRLGKCKGKRSKTCTKTCINNGMSKSSSDNSHHLPPTRISAFMIYDTRVRKKNG